MWWMLQIVGCAGVCIAQIINRKYGLCSTSWTFYSLIAIFITYPAFGKSFSIAPSFFSAWFLGQVCLNVFGLITAFLVFGDSVSFQQWVGLILAIISGYLLI